MFRSHALYHKAQGARTYPDSLDGFEEVLDGVGNGDGHLGDCDERRAVVSQVLRFLYVRRWAARRTRGGGMHGRPQGWGTSQIIDLTGFYR